MNQDAGAGMTARLVEAVRGLRYEDLPDEAREVARHCVLDWLGVTIAGAHEPLVDILVDAVVRPERSEDAALVGRRERATRPTAALVNGAAGHALDYDDAHMWMTGHPTAPVLPAILALAEGGAVSGKALLAALVAGIELECRLGAVLGGGHYDIGFHATGTLGTFGAAAACAHLLGLEKGAWQHAMGLAGTQAAGLKSAFGTMAKPLHAGRAAASGLLSALLARGGFTSAADIVEAKQGFAATHAGAAPDLRVLDGLTDRFLVRDTLFKYHAACYLTHAPIESARRLRARHAVDPQAVDAVEVTVAPALLGVCNIAEPQTGLEGKFSLRATTALALLGEDTGALGTYCEAKMTDVRLVRLRDCARVVTDTALAPTRARVAVSIGGRRLEEETDSGRPASDLSEQRSRLRAKFAALVVPVLGAEAAADLAEAALSIDRLVSVDSLLRRAGRSAAA
jgi:2-methylcitrate dehydratase PrpD